MVALHRALYAGETGIFLGADIFPLRVTQTAGPENVERTSTTGADSVRTLNLLGTTEITPEFILWGAEERSISGYSL